MSTTRHLINRQRRLATAPRPERVPVAKVGPEESVEPEVLTDLPDVEEESPDAEETDTEEPAAEEPAAVPAAPRRRVAGLPVVLGALTVLLGGFAAFAFGEAGTLRDDPSTSNTALTDIARTSEVKGQIGKAVSAVFSYNFATPAKSDQTAAGYLTGKAVEQHRTMLAAVREQAPKQKLVLTTTVTESGVELLDGDRARVLVYADQSNTRTAAKGGKAGETSYAAAMFAVDAVREKGTWRIANIDTFAR